MNWDEVFRFDLTNEVVMVLRMGVAAIAGIVIGWERKNTGHQAGIRTLTLVSVGASIFTLASIYGFVGEGVGGAGRVTDTGRVAAQVVTGVGFLGAGTIFVMRASVRGLTTAAAIWVAAALGMAAGAGLLSLTIIGTAFVACVLAFFPRGASPEEDAETRD